MYKYMPINYIGKNLKTKRETENQFVCKPARQLFL